MAEGTVYCGSCGGTLSATARFCRACGASQVDFTEAQSVESPAGRAPVPPSSSPSLLRPEPSPHPLAPSPRAWTGANATGGYPNTKGNRSAAYLAIAGGIGMCFMVLYATLYYPLHHGLPVNFGGSLQFGDLLALGSGAVAVLLGVLALKQEPPNPTQTGAVLVLAGVPTGALTMLWAYSDTLHIYPPEPFYFGLVYFSDLAQAHVGSGYIQVPLLVCSAAVFVAGCLMVIPRGRRASAPAWR